ncbi:MAG: nucleotidyltransferase [Gemmatimonadales bacterium]|nr:MAG: nucleotidyltransferase [Gemmatimonadales bacterium]
MPPGSSWPRLPSHSLPKRLPMKAIIPLAGKGTRLRPHTLTTPKPLVHVGGRPVMSYILDELLELGIDEMVFVVGYLQDVARDYIAREYPQIRAHFVVQEVQDGTAGAIKLAEPWVDDDVLILFVDTLFEADLSVTGALDPQWAGVIWAKEVEDYQRFGVIVTDEDGAMTRIVEKPSEPISRLANIGLYYIRDTTLLFEGINHVLASEKGASGEYYLTDAFQYMVDRGGRIRTAPVAGWYDCGKVDALLETNAWLVGGGRALVSDEARISGSEVDEPVRIEAGVRVKDSRIGPNVTLEAGARVENSTLRDCIVGAGAHLRDCRIHDSIVGPQSELLGARGIVNAGPHTRMVVDD